MKNKELVNAIKQDIEDIKGLLNFEKYELSNDLAKKQARAIILNLQDHIDDFLNK